jgi:hypothetical protein
MAIGNLPEENSLIGAPGAQHNARTIGDDVNTPRVVIQP